MLHFFVTGLGTFTWLVTEEILSEYKGVLSRFGVRRNLVGEIVNLLREEAEFVTIRSEDELSPDQTTMYSVPARSKGVPPSLLR